MIRCALRGIVQLQSAVLLRVVALIASKQVPVTTATITTVTSNTTFPTEMEAFAVVASDDDATMVAPFPTDEAAVRVASTSIR